MRLEIFGESSNLCDSVVRCVYTVNYLHNPNMMWRNRNELNIYTYMRLRRLFYLIGPNE